MGRRGASIVAQAGGIFNGRIGDESADGVSAAERRALAERCLYERRSFVPREEEARLKTVGTFAEADYNDR